MSGLWPSGSIAEPSVSDINVACSTTWERFASWLTQHRPSAKDQILLSKFESSVQACRSREVSEEQLRARPKVLLHPAFLIKQGNKNREIVDATRSGLNSCTHSYEKLILPSIDDVLDFAGRLHRADPSSEPLCGVADEDQAYRNYANSDPSLHVVVVFHAVNGVVKARFFEDWALNFGGTANVYNYNRFRGMLTVFMLHEFFTPVWSYFDDSALVSRRSLAWVLWFTFLRLHQALGVAIKGNPCTSRGMQSHPKLYPPAPCQRFLGEMATVGTLPLGTAPTAARLENCKELLLHIQSKRRLAPGMASTAAGKLRFLCGSLYGRVAHSALAAFYQRQSQCSDEYTIAVEASVALLLDLLAHASPQYWPWGVHSPAVLNLFGDASEPGCSSDPRICAGVLQDRLGSPLRYFAVKVPDSILEALLPRQKQICFLELLWPVLACILWGTRFQGVHVILFEDNQSARHGLRRGLSQSIACFQCSGVVQNA